MSVFEIIMLVCFGCAWPVSVYKSLTSKSVEGKSLFFMYIVLTGYISGFFHKVFYSFDAVIYLYVLNLLMVTTDILLFYRNKKLSKAG